MFRFQGGGEEKADWNWGAGDQEEGEVAGLHSEAPSWDRSLQSSDTGGRKQVRENGVAIWLFEDDSFPSTKTVEAARADGEKIRLIGGAEAKAVDKLGYRWN